MFRSKLRRHLHLESLEPRWTMDAQASGATVSPAADVQDVENSINQFALDLYQTISDSNSEPTDETISPFSIAAALAMTYAGANGETATQLAHALHIDLPPDRFHAAMGAILQDILPAASDTTTQLEIADALWGQAGFPFLDSFRQLTHDQYGADFREADFRHDPDGATAAINDWVKNQTHDMIKKLFDSLSKDTRLVLANALYFKASWAAGFNPSLTQRTVFHLASGSSMDVSMMQDTGYFNYTETSDYQIAELPYEGGRYSMVILLPKQAGANLPANFSAADLQNWLTALHSTDLAVQLPKFTLDTSLSLVDTLQSLGVTDAFDASEGGLADFSGIDGRRDLYISQVVHKAKVEVSETGTKAAAATGIQINLVSTVAYRQPQTLIPFYADHPFHFLIRDRQTDSILFVGQVQHPTAYDGNEPEGGELPKFVGPPGMTIVTQPTIHFPLTTNPANPYDVNGDGEESPVDVLIVINYVNDHSSPSAPIQQPVPLIGPITYPDVDGDGTIAPRDALVLINRLSQKSDDAAPMAIVPDSAQGEGETAASAPHAFASAVDLLLSLGDLATISNRPAARRT